MNATVDNIKTTHLSLKI